MLMFYHQFSKMHPDHVILPILYWTYFIIVTNGLDECHITLPSHCPKCDGVSEDNTTVVCCNVTNDFIIKEGMRGKNIKHLHFHNATITNLSLEANSNIEILTMTSGNIKSISFTGTFSNLKCLNLSKNHLTNVSIKNNSMPKLQIVDISKNNLTDLQEKTIKSLNSSSITSIDFSGNNRMSCAIATQLLHKLRNKNNTFCSFQSTYNWFDSAFQIRVPHLETTQCENTFGKQGCTCELFRFIPPTEYQPLKILLSVNCSNQGLIQLPPSLPPNTVSLDVSNNNITSLDQLRESSYSGVYILYAQNNHISSISALEGTPFMSNFSILDIRWNNLTSVPTYFLSNWLDRNIATKILLGGNKLQCDCNTAQYFKLWLSLHKKYVEDYDKIGCRNLIKSVMDLDPLDVCVTQRTWTDYIYYIIAGEVTLLILLVSKVSYDYWVFKTAGYLPWPASKMPKLPCDWVFET